MSIARSIILAICLTGGVPPAFACSCHNSTPVQQGFYGDRAVFTARVIQLFGKEYFREDGSRSATRALAIVHHRYWGLPRYWPKIVLLDGTYPCDLSLIAGREYLVVGRPDRYGILGVAGCSGTKPVEAARIDLHMLEASTCSAPGGCLLGFATLPGGTEEHPIPASNLELTFRDSAGKPHVTRTSSDGFYELRHLPPGQYAMDWRFGSDRFADADGFVTEGYCTPSSFEVRPYSLSGRLIPGMDNYSQVDLVATATPYPIITAVIAPNGRFFFREVPAGDYSLVATMRMPGRNEVKRVSYPGSPIHLNGRPSDQSYDFDPTVLPVVPIPILVQSTGSSRRLKFAYWLLNDANGLRVLQGTSWTGVPTITPGIRGETYSLVAYQQTGEGPDIQSEPVTFRASDGMKAVVLSLSSH